MSSYSHGQRKYFAHSCYVLGLEVANYGMYLYKCVLLVVTTVAHSCRLELHNRVHAWAILNSYSLMRCTVVYVCIPTNDFGGWGCWAGCTPPLWLSTGMILMGIAVILVQFARGSMTTPPPWEQDAWPPLAAALCSLFSAVVGGEGGCEGEDAIIFSSGAACLPALCLLLWDGEQLLREDMLLGLV